MSRTKMKRRWKYPVLLFALIAGWAPARDAPAEQAVSWSLRDAINYSLGHNPDLAVAHSRIEERQQQAGEVFAGFLPNLSVESGYSYLDNVPRVQIRFTQDIPIPNVPPLDINKDVDIGANDNYRAQLELSQLLFASGRVFYAHRAAKKRVRVSQLEEDAARLKTALRTAEAYYGALIADSYLAVQQEALATAQAHLEQVKNRHEAGAATRLQLLRAEVEVSNLEPRVTEAKKNGRLARILLRRATGLAEEVPIVLMDTLEAHVTEVALEGEYETPDDTGFFLGVGDTGDDPLQVLGEPHAGPFRQVWGREQLHVHRPLLGGRRQVGVGNIVVILGGSQTQTGDVEGPEETGEVVPGVAAVVAFQIVGKRDAVARRDAANEGWRRRPLQMAVQFGLWKDHWRQLLPCARGARPRCPAMVWPMSAKVSRRPSARGSTPGPKNRTGTCSRV